MRHLSLAALLAWAAAIFVVSGIPNPPDAGGGDWKYELAHVFEYTVFGALAFAAVTGYRTSPRLWLALAAWSVSVLYGMSDELHQSFVPNRDASWLDVGFDAIGATLGVAAAVFASARLLRPTRIAAPDVGG